MRSTRLLAWMPEAMWWMKKISQPSASSASTMAPETATAGTKAGSARTERSTMRQ